MPLTIATISGSLRARSFNSALLRAAASLNHEACTFTHLTYRDVPPYDGDVAAAGEPAAVTAFRDAIAGADGLLIATPEFNYSVPGVLKNAIDWASRPAYKSVFAGKPTAVLGASMSAVGSARAQGHLKQILLGMAAPVFAYPEFLLGTAHTKFDSEGTLTDPDTRRHLEAFVSAFAAWVAKH